MLGLRVRAWPAPTERARAGADLWSWLCRPFPPQKPRFASSRALLLGGEGAQRDLLLGPSASVGVPAKSREENCASGLVWAVLSPLPRDMKRFILPQKKGTVAPGSFRTRGEASGRWLETRDGNRAP